MHIKINGTPLMIVITLLTLILSFTQNSLARKSEPREIKVGVIAMLSGEYAYSGQDIVDAAVMVVDRVNEEGGIQIGRNKLRVTLIVEDDGNSPEGALNAAMKLIYQDGVTAIVGPQFSSNAIPVARLVEQEKVIMICPMSTNPETTSGKEYVFRIPFLDTFQGQALARFAREGIGAESAAVLYDIAGIYNRTVADVFSIRFEEYGGIVVASETYTTDQSQNFHEQLKRIAAVHPDVLFLPNYAADALLQAQQARSIGIQSVLLGGDGWNDTQFKEVPVFEGSFLPRHWHPEIANEKARSFVDSFQNLYERVPGDVSATTYDAVSILLEAIERAGNIDSAMIRENLYNMEPFDGVTGSIDYIDCGDPVKSVIIIEIRGGRTSVFAVMEPPMQAQ